MNHDPVRKVTLTEAVTNKILDYIKAGTLKPGDRLPPEKELVKLLGVSRPIVREALQRLITLNVIKTVPGQGASVKDIESTSVINPLALRLLLKDGREAELLWELRESLEVSLAGLAAERATEDDLGRIEKSIEAIRIDMESDRFDADIHMRVHYSIAEAAHNPLFLQVIRPVFELLTEYYAYQAPLESPSVDWHASHMELLDAIKSRNPDTARQAMRDHLKTSLSTWWHIETATSKPVPA